MMKNFFKFKLILLISSLLLYLRILNKFKNFKTWVLGIDIKIHPAVLPQLTLLGRSLNRCSQKSLSITQRKSP